MITSARRTLWRGLDEKVANAGVGRGHAHPAGVEHVPISRASGPAGSLSGCARAAGPRNTRSTSRCCTSVAAAPIATPVVYAQLLGRTLALARRRRPDVIYAHFLVPTGLTRCQPHGDRSSSPRTGTDVRNTLRSLHDPGSYPLRHATRRRGNRRITLPCRQGWPGSPEVISMGVDTDAFRPAPRTEWRMSASSSSSATWNERKNAGRLLEAFSKLVTGLAHGGRRWPTR